MGKFYSGRIGALAYFIGSVISYLGFWSMTKINSLHLSFFASSVYLVILVEIFLLWFSFSIIVRRLHDLGWSGWLALLMIVPVANAILGIILLFKPGQHETNKFGYPPKGGRLVLKELFLL